MAVMKSSRLCEGLVIFIIGVVLCFLPLPAGANQLVFGLDTVPDRLVPWQIKNPQTFPVSMQIFQGLMDVDGTGRVIPRLIEKWETKDYKSWIFHVRRGVYFHKSSVFGGGSREMTADDVVYSLTKHCSSRSYNSFLLTDSIAGAAAFNQGKAKQVKGISKIDRYSVKIELVKPERFFINRISTAWITVFPPEMDDKKYEKQLGFKLAVGTGPYVLKSWSPNEVVLEKNGNYWDLENQPKIEKLVFRVIRNDQVRLVNLQKAGIDMMVLPPSLYPAVLNRDGSLKKFLSGKYQVMDLATFNTHFIGINDEIVSDVNLRRAMFWGCNRQEIIDAVLYGFANETSGTVPPGLNKYRPRNLGKLYDPEKAKLFLSRSRYQGKPLELYLHDLAGSEQVAQIFQAQMAAIGIKIRLKKLDFNSVINKMVKGEAPLFSMFFEYVFSSPEPILINLFSSAKIPVPNFFHFTDVAVDKKLEALYSLQSEEKSLTSCADIEAEIMQRVPAIFLYRQKYVLIVPKNLAGVEVSGNNHYFMEKIRFTDD